MSVSGATRECKASWLEREMEDNAMKLAKCQKYEVECTTLKSRDVVDTLERPQNAFQQDMGT